ncbi:unnamed protein product [Eruca vesicaria subsp. sativa]|uniref:Uncharacterized protein n=1 Tax=Eruca vesicaria subsp. sativa TaxID=29727 RepID=A0ABC8L5A7_ERUVS|nr:unnamed protein product [Eruca vesicaria subsp. sativa]
MGLMKKPNRVQTELDKSVLEITGRTGETLPMLNRRLAMSLTRCLMLRKLDTHVTCGREI